MATGTQHIFAKASLSLGQKLANLGTDTLKCMLLANVTSIASLVQTAQFVSDVVAVNTELTTAGGYTAGGNTLTGQAWATTAANSWGTAAAVTTAYTVGTVVRPAAGNGFLYVATVGGTSGGAAPTWPTTVGATVTDGTVTWLNIGSAITALTATTPAWTSVTTGFTSYYAVYYDSTPGTAATNPVLCYVDYSGTPQTANNGGTMTVTSPNPIFWVPAS